MPDAKNQRPPQRAVFLWWALRDRLATLACRDCLPGCRPCWS